MFATTIDLGAQLSYTPLAWLTSRTSFGEQVSHVRFQGLRAGNTSETNLAFGTDLLSPAPVPSTGAPQLYEVAESRDEGAKGTP